MHVSWQLHGFFHQLKERIILCFRIIDCNSSRSIAVFHFHHVLGGFAAPIIRKDLTGRRDTVYCGCTIACVRLLWWRRLLLHQHDLYPTWTTMLQAMMPWKMTIHSQVNYQSFLQTQRGGEFFFLLWIIHPRKKRLDMMDMLCMSPCHLIAAPLLQSFNTASGINKESEGLFGESWTTGNRNYSTTEIRWGFYFVSLFYVIHATLSSNHYPFSLLQHIGRRQRRRREGGNGKSDIAVYVEVT